MSLGTPSHALNLQTNVNASRYFFATQEAGEQQLFLSTVTTGNISTGVIGITGPAGNAVQYTVAPSFVATEFLAADQGLAVGGASTYWTASTITSTITGISMSTDRTPGSGVACIESYGGNGGLGGFEFLSRGVDSALVSTNTQSINQYLSSVGRPTATAALGASGTFLTAQYQGAYYNSIDYATGGGGRGAYTISDLSGANGSVALARWAMGTSVPPTGSNVGSDFTLYSYNDAGGFLGSPLKLQRVDGSMQIQNISSIFAEAGQTSKGQVFPIIKDNTEFGASNNVAVIGGASTNSGLFGSSYAPLFSTPVTGLNPTYQSLVAINWDNSLSTASNLVTYKVGFSTSTAYTNILQTSFVPGLGASWTPSDQPSATTPIGATNICCVVDPDGLTPQGDGMLYVLGQLADPAAPADQLFIAKGIVTEATRNAFCYRTV